MWSWNTPRIAIEMFFRWFCKYAESFEIHKRRVYANHEANVYEPKQQRRDSFIGEQNSRGRVTLIHPAQLSSVKIVPIIKPSKPQVASLASVERKVFLLHQQLWHSSEFVNEWHLLLSVEFTNWDETINLQFNTLAGRGTKHVITDCRALQNRRTNLTECLPWSALQHSRI